MGYVVSGFKTVALKKIIVLYAWFKKILKLRES